MPRGVYERKSRSSSPSPPTELDAGHPPNLKRQLGRNDSELAALSKLHVALRTLKEAIVEEYGEEALVQCVVEDGKKLPVSNVKEEKKEGETDEEPALAEENDSNTEEDAKDKRLQQLTTAFLLRMKLRRRLLNRLARRLHRVAHALDGGQIAAPLPPAHGDVVRRYVTEEMETSGFAATIIGSGLDTAKVVRKGDLDGLEAGEEKRKEARGKLERQRLRRLGKEVEEKEGGEDKEEDDEEAADDEPKSGADLLLQGDEEDAALLDELAEYEPGYDKLYSIGPPPPLPPPTPTSPSKKGAKPFPDDGGKDDAKVEANAEGTEATTKGTEEKQVLQTTVPLAATADPHEVDDDGNYLAGPKGDTPVGPSRAAFSLYEQPMTRVLDPKEQATEWKRWTKEMCERIPDQATFDELGVGGRGVVFDLENRLKKRGRDDENDGEVDKAVVRGKGKVLRKAEKPDDEDGDAKMGEAGAGDEPTAEDAGADKTAEGKKGEGTEKQADLLKKQSVKTFSVNPTPSFHYQDIKRVRILQNEIVKHFRTEKQRQNVHKCEALYDAAYQRSMAIQQEKATAIPEYHRMIDTFKREEAEFEQRGREQLVLAKSHWQRRQLQLKDIKDKIGEDGALAREVGNDVLQDMKDRVTVRAAEGVTPSGLGTHRLAKAAQTAKSEGDVGKEEAATVLSHVLDGVERKCFDEMCANETFVPPKVAGPHTTIADPDTLETMAQLHARKAREGKRRISMLDDAFKLAEKKRADLWQAVQKAKGGGSGGQARKQQRSRKSTGSSGAYPMQQQMSAAQLAQMQAQRMQAQQMRQAPMQRQGFPVPAQYYQQHQQQVMAAAQQAQRTAASAQRHNQVMAVARQGAYVQPAPPNAMALGQQPGMPMGGGVPGQNPAAMPGQPLAVGMPGQQPGMPMGQPGQNPAAVPGQPVAVGLPGQQPMPMGQPGQNPAAAMPGQPVVVGLPGQQRTVYNYGDRYSQSSVNARKNADGTVVPVTAPKLLPDGTFARPSGRQRKGMDWDAQRGVWYPAPGGGAEGNGQG